MIPIYGAIISLYGTVAASHHNVEWFDETRFSRGVIGARRIRDCEVVLRGICEYCIKEISDGK